VSNIFVISDIHGYYEQMLDSLKNVNLNDQENKLIFLGDYVDGGSDSCKVLYFIKALYERHKEQIIVLLGNHDEWFLDWLYSEVDELQWFSLDQRMSTVKSFLSEAEYREILESIKSTRPTNKKVSILFKNVIKKKHHHLLEWFLTISKQPRFIETDRQIFVHAGILEEAGDLWKHGTTQDYFTQKYPAEIGLFYKEIIAGHVSSAEVANNDAYLGKVYWDGESHFYIDGTVEKSGTIPILKYDTINKRYSAFEKDKADKKWREVFVNL